MPILENLPRPQFIPSFNPLPQPANQPRELPKEILDQLPKDWKEQLTGDKKPGNIVIFPDLNKLYDTVLENRSEYNQKKMKAKMEREKAKLWAAKFISEQAGGGVYTYLSNKKKPYLGVPHTMAVSSLGQVKRIIPTLIKTLPLPALIITAPFILLSYKRILGAITDFFSNALQGFKLQEIYWATPVKETRRVMGILIKKHCYNDEQIRFGNQLQDTISVVLEYDNAYRFRWMDVFNIVRTRVFLEENLWEQLKEINRIFDNMIWRENIRENKTSMLKKAKWGAMIAYLLYPILRNLVKDFCKEVDITKLQFTDNEKDFLHKRPDYLFESLATHRMFEIWGKWKDLYRGKIERAENKLKEEKNKRAISSIKKEIAMCQREIKKLDWGFEKYKNVPRRETY